MIIKTLVENRLDDAYNVGALGTEHGLSLYIETKNHNVLFDTGASSLFAKNAAQMGVDLSQVDIAIISHGHYDHGGGIETFLETNTKAKVYISNRAFDEYYSIKESNEKYIGLDKSLLNNDRIVLIEGSIVIDDELELLSDINGDILCPPGNKQLYMKNNGSLINDRFDHEQNLIINQDGVITLISGCAHNGIVNIINKYHYEKGRMPDYIIGGFHLDSGFVNQCESNDTVDKIGEYLSSTSSTYFTCHCTGTDAYERLKVTLGDKIEYLSTGRILVI